MSANINKNFNRFNPLPTPDVPAGVGVNHPHEFYNNFPYKFQKSIFSVVKIFQISE